MSSEEPAPAAPAAPPAIKRGTSLGVQQQIGGTCFAHASSRIFCKLIKELFPGKFDTDETCESSGVEKQENYIETFDNCQDENFKNYICLYSYVVEYIKIWFGCNGGMPYIITFLMVEFTDLFFILDKGSNIFRKYNTTNTLIREDIDEIAKGVIRDFIEIKKEIQFKFMNFFVRNTGAYSIMLNGEPEIDYNWIEEPKGDLLKFKEITNALNLYKGLTIHGNVAQMTNFQHDFNRKLGLFTEDTTNEFFKKTDLVLNLFGGSGHAMVIKDWNKNELKVLNSWGRDWGNDGTTTWKNEDYNKFNTVSIYGVVYAKKNVPDKEFIDNYKPLPIFINDAMSYFGNKQDKWHITTTSFTAFLNLCVEGYAKVYRTVPSALGALETALKTYNGAAGIKIDTIINMYKLQLDIILSISDDELLTRVGYSSTFYSTSIYPIICKFFKLYEIYRILFLLITKYYIDNAGEAISEASEILEKNIDIFKWDKEVGEVNVFHEFNITIPIPRTVIETVRNQEFFIKLISVESQGKPTGSSWFGDKTNSIFEHGKKAFSSVTGRILPKEEEKKAIQSAVETVERKNPHFPSGLDEATTELEKGGGKTKRYKKRKGSKTRKIKSKSKSKLRKIINLKTKKRI